MSGQMRAPITGSIDVIGGEKKVLSPFSPQSLVSFKISLLDSRSAARCSSDSRSILLPDLVLPERSQVDSPDARPSATLASPAEFQRLL
jgi:hypothetical protein